MMHEATQLGEVHERFAAKLGRVLPTLRDVRTNIVNYLRSGIIGTFVGVLPAIGGGSAGLIAYAQAPKHILLPVLFVLAATGVFSMNDRLFDVLAMCGFGLLGYILERFRYPLPPFILGMIFGPLVEGNFRKMVGAEEHAWNLFTKPIAATFLALAVASIIYSLYRRRRGGGVLVAPDTEAGKEASLSQ